MKGVRHALRNFTAMSVKEHLRSQAERADRPPELTENEIELVRFIREGSFDWSGYLDDQRNRSNASSGPHGRPSRLAAARPPEPL